MGVHGGWRNRGTVRARRIRRIQPTKSRPNQLPLATGSDWKFLATLRGTSCTGVHQTTGLSVQLWRDFIQLMNHGAPGTGSSAAWKYTYMHTVHAPGGQLPVAKMDLPLTQPLRNAAGAPLFLTRKQSCIGPISLHCDTARTMPIC
jgi:hypothetical protein